VCRDGRGIRYVSTVDRLGPVSVRPDGSGGRTVRGAVQSAQQMAHRVQDETRQHQTQICQVSSNSNKISLKKEWLAML